MYILRSFEDQQEWKAEDGESRANRRNNSSHHPGFVGSSRECHCLHPGFRAETFATSLKPNRFAMLTKLVAQPAAPTKSPRPAEIRYPKSSGAATTSFP